MSSVRELQSDRQGERVATLSGEVADRTAKVCLVVNEFPPDRTAGTAIATHALSRFLVAQGFDVSVIVTERRPGSPAAAEEEGIRVYRLYAGRVPVLRWLNRMRKIRRLVGAASPDLLHAQAISCGFYSAVAARGRGIPVMTSIQGQDLYQASPLQKRTEVRWTLRHSDRVTAVSRGLAKLAEAVTGIAPVEVVPHGFTRETGLASREALRERFALAPDDRVVLCAARLDPIKGVDVLVRAAADVPKSTVWIAGGGPEQPRLRGLSDSLGLGGRVAFLGNLPHRLLAERMAAADLFVLPSRSEAFGIVLVEAMDAGLPVIATTVGGIPELVDRDNGLLIPAEDPKALAEAIRTLLDDPPRCAAMSRANRQKAAAYEWGAVGERYVSLYRGLLSGRRSR